MPVRKIIHIDMDAFFASVEQRERPSLRGLPIAVGYDGPRSVVTTASYEARKYGVRSAMSMTRAKQLCRDLIIVPCNFALYKDVSRQIHDVFREYTDLIEPISLDEAFLDVTVNKSGTRLAQDIAMEIKSKIYERVGLTASAGVSYNKFIAKIASDFRKPDGLTVVHPDRALDFIAPLPIEDFWGVGPKTAERMHSLGIHTGLDLRQQPLSMLLAHFGKAGHIYYDFARGIDERPVEPSRERKSVGCEETYPSDLYLHTDIAEEIDHLAERLVNRLSRSRFEGHTLTLKVKFHDFTVITRSKSADDFFKHHDIIVATAMSLIDNVDYSQERPIRLLGLTVSNPDRSTRQVDTHPTLFTLDELNQLNQ